MRRIGLILLLLSSLCLLFAQTKIDNITVNGENPIVTRVVISLSQEADWSYQTDTDKHIVTIKLNNCNSTNPPIEGLINSPLLKQITTEISKTNTIVNIHVSGPFYIETLHVENPYKVVIDLFKYQKDYSYQDQLAQAAFYTKSGKWFAAGKQYAQIRRDFPREVDANYLWAKLLLKQRNFEKAKAKLRAVPNNSGFYKDAQALLAKLESNTYTEPKEPVVEPKATTEPVSCTTSDTTTCVNPVKFVPRATFVEIPGFSFKGVFIDTKRNVSLKWAEIPIWGWFIMLLIGLIACLIIVDFIHHHHNQSDKIAKKGVSLISDDSIKAAMVRKLIENGWNEAEIARELLINIRDVKHYAKSDE